MTVPNLWLKIPLADYEGHMNAPEVGQLCVLADLFGEALARCSPASVAIFGIAGGNGLDRIDPAMTQRVVGFDCNVSYLDAVRQRYAGLPGLELHCLDLSAQPVAAEPVELVHAALVFEHAGPGRCLENAIALVAPGGTLSVVLQLPGNSGEDVAPTSFGAIQQLRDHFSLIDPADLRQNLERRGFHLQREERRSLPAGKGFWAGLFQR